MIKFGTAGWRAVVAEEFTFLNVRKAAHAIASHVKENLEYGANSVEYREFAAAQGKAALPRVVVGFDTRFMSEDFAQEVAAVFAADGVRTLLSDGDAPTPVIGVSVVRQKALGGLMVTASHNGPLYNGLKWMPFWGGAAPLAVTSDIERRIELSTAQTVKAMAVDRSLREAWVESAALKAGYFKHLQSLIDVAAIKKSKLRIAVDSMHGAARNYLRPFLEGLGLEVIGLNESRDVLFGGRAPAPSESSLEELTRLVASRKADLGLACDGDADRFGIIDAGGRWVAPNDVLALVCHHLAENRGLKGKVARSLMTSHFLDAVAKSHGFDVRETPVGFKFIGELLRTGQFLMGGEESGGLSIAGHIPDKDGILACLLMVELMAYEKSPLHAVRDRLFKQVGAFHHARADFSLGRPREVIELQERLRTKPPLSLAGASVWRIDESDGFKFILRDGSWLGLRSSGTEPALRLYAEARDPKMLDALLKAGQKLVTGK